MRLAHGMVDDEGSTRTDVLRCEHCRNMQVHDSKKPIDDVVCKKCGMTRDKK